MTRKEKAFANMLVDKKNLNNVLGLNNPPAARGLPKKKADPAAPAKKKK